MRELATVRITVQQKDADDGFRDIQRMMFQRDVRNLRRQLETERRRRRRAQRETERQKILRKWKLWAILGAVICAQIGAVAAVLLWMR